MGKRVKKRHGCLKAFLILAILLILAAVGLFAWGWISIVPDREATNENYEFRNDRINVLVVGTDAGGTGENDTGRADSIMVFNLDLKHHVIAGISIPRDSRVEIPEHGETKINHSYAYGGIELTKQTVEDLLQVPIDYYAVTNFAGFEQVVEILGGVTLNVETEMHTHTYYGDIDLEPGVQHLDAQEALGYVRYRYDAGGDFARGQRQQQFLKAVFEEMVSTQNILKWPSLISAVTEVVETDFTVSQLTYLATCFAGMDMNTDFLSLTPEATTGSVGGGSYVFLDEEALAEMVQTYFINDYDPVLWGKTEGDEQNTETEN